MIDMRLKRQVSEGRAVHHVRLLAAHYYSTAKKTQLVSLRTKALSQNVANLVKNRSQGLSSSGARLTK